MSFLETGFILPSRGAQPPGDLFSQALTPACIRRAVSSLFKQSPPVSSRGAQRRGDLFSQAILLPHPASEEQSAADSNSLRLCHRERAARGDLFSPAISLTPACIRGAVSSGFNQFPPVSSRACSAWRSLFPGYFTYPSLHQRSSQQLIQTVSACVIASVQRVAISMHLFTLNGTK